MRSAPLLSGNVMKIFRFRDRLAGGALYSGRWGRPASCSYLYCRDGEISDFGLFVWFSAQYITNSLLSRLYPSRSVSRSAPWSCLQASLFFWWDTPLQQGLKHLARMISFLLTGTETIEVNGSTVQQNSQALEYRLATAKFLDQILTYWKTYTSIKQNRVDIETLKSLFCLI